MSTNTAAKRQESVHPRMPLRLHHHAHVVRDQERTRHFYEDILEMPLQATWIERVNFEGNDIEMSHTFFGLEDGSALAFFNFADEKIYDKYNAGPVKSLFYHIALAVDEGTQQRMYKRLKAEGLDVIEYDHGYCKSIYVVDPDGLRLEFTVDPQNVDAINAHQKQTARKSLDAWQKGDRRPNNDIRKHT